MGQVWWDKCDKCNKSGLIYNPKTESSSPCDCKKKAERNKQLEVALEKSPGFSQFIFPRQLMLSFDSKKQYKGNQNHIIKLEIYIKNFKNKYRWHNLYFWSKENGTQKTTTARWIAKELLLKNFSIAFIQLKPLVTLLTNFKLNANKYLYADFLIIDNLFKLYNNLQLSSLDSFLRQRLDEYHKATCFTSNLSISELNTIFNTSIELVIKRNTITMGFKDIVPPLDSINIENIWDEEKKIRKKLN